MIRHAFQLWQSRSFRIPLLLCSKMTCTPSLSATSAPSLEASCGPSLSPAFVCLFTQGLLRAFTQHDFQPCPYQEDFCGNLPNFCKRPARLYSCPGTLRTSRVNCQIRNASGADNVLELFLAQCRPDRIENWSMYFRCTLQRSPFIPYNTFLVLSRELHIPLLSSYQILPERLALIP